MPRILVTGGAGFVGANVCVGLADRHPEWALIAFDNLHRRGSRLNLPRLDKAGVRFVLGDVRDPDGLGDLDSIDAIVECSAEPSALVGMSGDTRYSFETNLGGAFNCLELARREQAQFVFLSTSRVYPYRALSDLRLDELPSRFDLAAYQTLPGVSPEGIAEDFPLLGPRTLYGATKLAAELLVAEYAANFDVRAVINRCGVIAGPWQMGRVDQGVFTFWLLHHHFRRPLAYIGYDGSGKQVRDLLHVADLVELIETQLFDPIAWDGFAGNVGGGRERSLSLVETTEICRQLTGAEVPINTSDDLRPGDVPLYISDCSRLYERTDWRPRRAAREVLEDTYDWLLAHEGAVAGELGY